MEMFTAGWFDFKSHGVDENIYNIMYCLPIGGKAMHGVFDCPITAAELWKPCVLEVIRLMKDLTINPFRRFLSMRDRATINKEM